MQRFLQARLHLDSLFTKTDLRKFKAALNSLPEGLDETYDEVMSRTLAQHPDYIALARKVIYWVFYAVRPLTLKEIQHALAVEPDDTFLDEDSIVDEELLISVCTGIITVQHESDVVGLVHYTAQQYLERKAVEYFPEAQDEILRTCLTYLSFKEFDKGPCRKVKKLEARLKSWPLLRYAAQHWAEHASFKKSAFQNSNLLQGLANKFSSGRADDPLTHQNPNISGSQAAAIVPRGQVVNQTDLKGDESLLSVILGQPDSQVDILSSNTSDRGVSNLELITRFLNQGAKVASSMEVAALKNVFRFSLHTRTFTSNISPLCVCAFFNLESIAQLLLYKGASTLIKDDCGTTPLHFTALYGNEAMTQTLLEHGAEIAARDLWDSTPLHQAALRGHEAVLRALLIKGADVVAEDVRGYTPLHEAVLQGHCMVTNTLLEYGADLTAQSRAKETPLHVAAGNSFNAVTRLLLEKGADVNIKDDRGRTPLHVFIMGGTSLMALFLKNAADLTIKDDGGMTVLHFAAQYGRKSLTRLLLESGAETESTDNHERTPLHLAARIEHKALVEILIKGGASLGARDDQGMTALHYAAESENESIMQLLLDYGANIKSRDRDGRSVMDITFHMCNRSATQLLLRNGADTFGHSKDWGSKLQAAAQKGDENMVQLLLEFGANIHASGGLISQGRNALHLACGAGSSGCVEVLLKYGSDPHILDGQKRTCLHHAASSDSAKALTRLLKEGLDPMVGDIDGWTSIDWAAKAGRLTNIKILSEAVAGPIDTWKPKSIAIYHGQMSIADYLETLSQRSMENVVEGPPNEAFPTETPRRINEIEYLPSGSVGRPVPNGGPNIQDFPSGNLESEFVSGRAELTDIGKCQLQAMPAPQHLRVWCDGCDLPICGSRYKCSVCANFDYCFKCVASSHDNHSSHHFMAVEGPNVIYHKPKSDARSQNAADYVL